MGARQAEHAVTWRSTRIQPPASHKVYPVLPTRQLPFCFQGMPLMMPAQGLDKLNRRNPRQRLVGIPVFTPYRRQLAVRAPGTVAPAQRSEEHTSELQSRPHLVCRLLLEKKK